MLHNRLTAAQIIPMAPMRLNFRSQPQPSSATVKYASMLFCALAVGLTALPASAEELTHDQMVCALDPQCVMPLVSRRLRGVAGSSARITRGSFDRTINFGFDSAELTPLARSELDQVAAVLKDPHVDKYTIVIHGHTDDVGTVEYNQGLSERRAEAARQYFITQHGIDPNRLIARGHGKSQLLYPNDPTNELNRRVQFENANYATASMATPRPMSSAPVHQTPSATEPNPASGADGDGL